jgi:predicted nucleic acid-binding protein
MFKRIRIFRTIILVLVLFASLSCKAKMDEPKIMDLIITNNEQNVLLYARLLQGFKADMESAIMAGVPKEFIIHVKVYEERARMWDKKISSRKIRRTIQYDNLKEIYSVITNGNPEPVAFADLQDAQKAMEDFDGIIITPITALETNKNYYLKVKIVMEKFTLPLSLERMLFFVSYLDHATDWYKQKFILKQIS